MFMCTLIWLILKCLQWNHHLQTGHERATNRAFSCTIYMSVCQWFVCVFVTGWCDGRGQQQYTPAGASSVTVHSTAWVLCYYKKGHYTRKALSPSLCCHLFELLFFVFCALRLNIRFPLCCVTLGVCLHLCLPGLNDPCLGAWPGFNHVDFSVV